ncbi:MAG TPA: hypothetical protein VNH20_02460 [Candidatus Dormibacteraeota bacterium]|nr:hypothetical protein [Candidatus Dormibacteraeota bacterium]
MSRWLTRGLRSGVRTTRFPDPGEAGEEGAASSVRLRWQALAPAQALVAARDCPTTAIEASGTESVGEMRFDAGACIMCGRCSRAFPEAFTAAPDPRVSVLQRDRLRATVRWSAGEPLAPAALHEVAVAVRRKAHRLFGRSLHIRHVDAGSCNGCESELQQLASPYVDLQRLGLFFTPTPRHADALLVTGVVTRNLRSALLATYAAMPAPKLVVAAGACAISCGSFAGGPMTVGPLDRLLPVDAYVPGCPPTPQALLHGLLLAIGRASERANVLEEASDGA